MPINVSDAISGKNDFSRKYFKIESEVGIFNFNMKAEKALWVAAGFKLEYWVVSGLKLLAIIGLIRLL